MRMLLLVFAMGIGLIACETQQASAKEETSASKSKSGEVTKTSLKSTDDKLNYSVGYEIGMNIKRNNLALNEAIFMKGINDSVAEKDPLLSEEEMREVKQEHAKTQREQRKKEREELGTKNKEEGEKFMAENKAKDGVVTTESGLQYKVLKAGEGEKPKETDRVEVNYKGTLIDGTEFDSSFKRNKPATFAVNRVVKGWSEALQLMPVGSKWQLYIPADLGYGPRGAGAKIGPNAVLIFEVELLKIVTDEKPEQKPGPAAKAVPAPKTKPEKK